VGRRILCRPLRSIANSSRLDDSTDTPGNVIAGHSRKNNHYEFEYILFGGGCQAEYP
jgi:hypothetical protein